MKKAKNVVLGKLSKNVSFILQDTDNLTEESIKSSRGLVWRRKGGGGAFWLCAYQRRTQSRRPMREKNKDTLKKKIKICNNFFGK